MPGSTVADGGACRRAARSGKTLDSWTDPLALTTNERSDCTHDHHLLLVGVLDGSSGYAITWLARRGEDDARREDFEEILRTFRFTG